MIIALFLNNTRRSQPEKLLTKKGRSDTIITWLKHTHKHTQTPCAYISLSAAHYTRGITL